MIIGYTSGVFDLLHRGHHNYLYLCKQNCDVLCVAVDTDYVVKTKKGSDRPSQNRETRLNQVKNMSIVDLVIYKEKRTIYLLKEINPSIYFVPDNKPISNEIKDYARAVGMNIFVIPYTHGVSTTLLLDKNHG